MMKIVQSSTQTRKLFLIYSMLKNSTIRTIFLHTVQGAVSDFHTFISNFYINFESFMPNIDELGSEKKD